MSTAGVALPSKLLMRLEAAIARAVHPVDKACLRAERAGHWARQGHFEQAQAEIDELHLHFDRGPHPAVSAWLCLAEGLLAFFSSVSDGARDKMKRAHALSSASRLPQLQALAAAWLAHTEYVALDFEATAKHAREALDLSAADHHSARARVSVTLATALHFAERLDLAQPWYAKAREHALLDGDEAMVSALSTNMAWQYTTEALQASVFGGPLNEHVRHALAGAMTTESFDRWVGTASLGSWLPMVRAVLLSVQGQTVEALALYETHLEAAKSQGLGRLGANFLADMAWCRWRDGDAAGALKDAKAAVASLDLSTHADYKAVAHGRLAQVFRALGEEEQALAHDVQARDFWNRHRAMQAEVSALLSGFVPR